MTTPELDPEHNSRLRELAEYRNSLGCAPIDEDANRLVDSLLDLTDDTIADPELIEKSIDFMSRLVGWSSKDIDEATGQIKIADFDMTDSHDTQLDRLGVNFLDTSDNVTSVTEVNEDTHTTQYFFHQLRKSGKVRAITVYRKESLNVAETPSVTYCLTYEDVGRHGPDSENLLAVGRLWLESTPPVKIAFAAMEKTAGVRDRAFKLGHNALTALRPAETTPTEDS